MFLPFPFGGISSPKRKATGRPYKLEQKSNKFKLNQSATWIFLQVQSKKFFVWIQAQSENLDILFKVSLHIAGLDFQVDIGPKFSPMCHVSYGMD
jgi:hypothetical protein